MSHALQGFLLPRQIQRLALAGLGLLLAGLAACGGGSTPPEIDSFSASASAARAGQTVTLSAEFSDGTGRIEPDVGAVSSGQRVSVTMGTTTRYTLTVTNDAGVAVSQSVDIALIQARDWDFTSAAEGWQTSAEEGASAGLSGGKLVVRASQYELDGRCTSARATAALDALRAAVPDWQQASFTFDIDAAYGTGMGYPTVLLSWDGRVMDFRPGDLSNARWRVVLDRASGKASHYLDGVLRETASPTVDGSAWRR
jgi:hypothetical protein